jgi:hypothetical protein
MKTGLRKRRVLRGIAQRSVVSDELLCKRLDFGAAKPRMAIFASVLRFHEWARQSCVSVTALRGFHGFNSRYFL